MFVASAVEPPPAKLFHCGQDAFEKLVGAPVLIPAPYDNQIMLGTAAETVEVPGAFKVAGSPVWKAWTGTQAQYDAIVTKDSGTLYVVI